MNDSRRGRGCKSHYRLRCNATHLPKQTWKHMQGSCLPSVQFNRNQSNMTSGTRRKGSPRGDSGFTPGFCWDCSKSQLIRLDEEARDGGVKATAYLGSMLHCLEPARAQAFIDGRICREKKLQVLLLHTPCKSPKNWIR